MLGTALIVVIGKSLVAFAAMHTFGHDSHIALTIPASPAQVGEFPSILIGLGISLETPPDHARGLLLVTATLPILLNPLMFALINRFKRGMAPKPATAD